jgi:nucleoside-diphosphate-sugar epimerase
MGHIDLKNKRVVVTGGNGYLGSFLVKALKKEGAEVFVMSRNVTPSIHNFEVNLSDFDRVQKVIRIIKPEIVYHLAASISRNRDFSIYESMARVNVSSTLNVLRALDGFDAHFIFTSSSEIYGNNVSPFQETQIPMPVSPYSLTKVQAEYLIQTYCSNHNKKFTNLRIFNFYGEGMSEDFFISQMIHSLKRGEDFLMTKGEQTRDFLYVSDVVQALLLTAKNTESYQQTMNVCSGKGIKLCDLAMAVNNEMQSKAQIVIGAIPYRDNEVWEMIGDNSKIKEKLGFEPQVNTIDGIKRVINYNG